MTLKPGSENRNFAIAFIITIVSALCLMMDSWIVGKNNFFLLVNADLGIEADFIFSYITYLGDGAIWVVVAILFFIYRRNKFPMLIAAILVSTLITQVTKKYLLPAVPRPIAAIADLGSIHTVAGVEVHAAHSFPSGHTATAFTIYLLACLLIRNKWIIPIGFMYALLVGYSRVYLAQHFPLDIGGGMLTAVITILVSLFIQKQWELKKAVH
ncbi:MAG: phosphatase PAP2 family protein [Sediminibacterium sp.]|nr:phosphatase PAP2 family protein [Sediminibacterium sp.]MDP3667297.1 phosphatase PAP2 family protein [Sediminibacterium sp.]